MTVVVEAPLAREQTRRTAVAHLKAPGDVLRGLCGARLKGTLARPDSDRCVVCLDLARRGFVGR